MTMKIGVLMPIDEQKHGQTASYREIRDLAIATEAAGFDSVWVNDHLLYRQTDDGATRGIWEAWTVLAGLAEATSRVQLGTIVLCGPFRNPAVLAKMADTLDEMSGGRVILGIGAGWHQPEFDAFGLPFDHLASRFEESAEIITSLLRTGESTFEGSYYQTRNAVLKPHGPRTGKAYRDGGIELMISGNRPRMARAVANYADSWNAGWLGRVTGLPAKRAALDRALEEVGKPADAVEVTSGLNIRFPDLEREVYGEHASPTDNVNPDSVIIAEPDEMAGIFRDYEAVDVTHLQIMYFPPTLAGLDRLAEALRIYRGK